MQELEQRIKALEADLKAERDLRAQVNKLANNALERAELAEKRVAKLEDAILAWSSNNAVAQLHSISIELKRRRAQQKDPE